MNTKIIKDKKIHFNTENNEYSYNSINEKDLEFYLSWYMERLDYKDSENNDFLLNEIRGVSNLGYIFIVKNSKPCAEVYICKDKIFKIKNLHFGALTFSIILN